MRDSADLVADELAFRPPRVFLGLLKLLLEGFSVQPMCRLGGLRLFLQICCFSYSLLCLLFGFLCLSRGPAGAAHPLKLVTLAKSLCRVMTLQSTAYDEILRLPGWTGVKQREHCQGEQGTVQPLGVNAEDQRSGRTFPDASSGP